MSRNHIITINLDEENERSNAQMEEFLSSSILTKISLENKDGVFQEWIFPNNKNKRDGKGKSKTSGAGK